MNPDVSHNPESGEESRICTFCKRVQVPLSERRKMCAKCREKNRERSRARALKLKALTSVAGSDVSMATQEKESDESAKRKAEEDPTNVWQNMKKRFKKSSKEGEEKNSVGRVLGTVTHSPAGLRTTEFQTASDMYKALKTLSRANKPLQFHGTFSIVAKADTDDVKRARLVMDELRKIAKISFAYKKSALSASHLLTFKCTCMASAYPPKTFPSSEASGAATSLRTKQSALTAWAGAKPKASEPGTSATPTVDCNGKITIVAEEDSSHPLGIKGQKVTVVLEH